MNRDQPHLRRLLEAGDLGGFVKALEPLCHREAQRVAPNGLDYDDLVQEARLGVFLAGRNWTAGRGANPLTLAVTYVRRRLWNATGREMNTKRRANLDAYSLDAPTPHGPEHLALHGLVAAGASTETLVEARDELRAIVRRLDATPPELLTGPWAARARAHIARGGGVTPDVVYRPRRGGQTAETLMANLARNIHVVPLRATKRKLIDGRERAPQGRPTLDGRLGTPVWRIDILRLHQQTTDTQREVAA